ncbi:MAG: hypothetical protein ACR2QM_16470, partial [Longimicrobiales bacterium]
IERMRESDPEVRVLYMSGFSEEFLVKRGKLESGSHFLEKPFTEEALASSVRASLDASLGEPEAPANSGTEKPQNPLHDG